MGCDDTPAPTSTAPAADASVRQAAAWQSSERGDAAVELTRIVARAFSDPGLRNRVKNDMRNSPFLEHKLPFGSYLKGAKGGILLAKMAQHSDRSKDEVLQLLDRLDPLRLELYMPFDEHRASWTGGSDVIVASQFDEGQEPAAFTTGGEPHDLELDELEETPERPVLALVPAETDYRTPPAPDALQNTRDRNGRAIGVYERADAPEVAASKIAPSTGDGSGEGGGGGGGIDWDGPPPGLYMHDNYIDDVGEGGLKGDPELETHLTAPVDQDDDNMEDIQCAGQEELGTFQFNQDDNDFNDAVRVATAQQFDQFEATFGTDNGMNVSLVEDDDTTCEIKEGDDRFQEFVKATAAAVGFADAIRRGNVNADAIAEQAPAVLRNFVTASVNLIGTNDDNVGMIVQGENVCAPDGETRGWLIKKESNPNGCTRLQMND